MGSTLVAECPDQPPILYRSRRTSGFAGSSRTLSKTRYQYSIEIERLLLVARCPFLTQSQPRATHPAFCHLDRTTKEPGRLRRSGEIPTTFPLPC